MTQHWETLLRYRSFDVSSYIVVGPPILHSSIIQSVTSSDVGLGNTFEKHSSTLQPVTKLFHAEEMLLEWLKYLVLEIRYQFFLHGCISMVTILNCWLRVLIWFQLGWLMTQLAHTCQMKNVTNYNWLAAVMIWIWQILPCIFSSNSFHNSLFSEAD